MAWPYSWDWPVSAVLMPIFLVPLKDVWPLLVLVLPPQAATRVSAATARAAHRARLPIEGITGLALLLRPFGSRWDGPSSRHRNPAVSWCRVGGPSGGRSSGSVAGEGVAELVEHQ